MKMLNGLQLNANYYFGLDSNGCQIFHCKMNEKLRDGVDDWKNETKPNNLDTTR